MGWGRGGIAVAVAVVVVTAACGSEDGSSTDSVDAGGSVVVDVPAGGEIEVEVRLQGFEPRGILADVVSDPAGCAVAVGRWEALRGGMEAGWWSSADCVAFAGRGPSTAEPEGDALPSDDKTLLTGVAARPRGDFIAVGYTEEHADDFASEMNVYVMDGAGGLSRVVIPEPAAQRAHHDVIVSQAGTVLVTGVDGPIGGAGAAVWRSGDLAEAAVPAAEWEQVPATWERVALPPSSAEVVFTDPTEILQRADGTLVIVGGSNSAQDSREQDPAAWVSTDDGRSWVAADPVGAFTTDGPMRRIGAIAELAGQGLLGVGRYGDGGCLWRSEDGLAWSEVTVEEACGELWTADIAASDRGVIVVGSSEKIRPPDQNDDRRGTLWYSADATDWTRVDLAEGTAYGALPTATGFIVLGGTDGYITWTARVEVDPRG